MLDRIRRRIVADLSEPVPPRELIGWAVALGLLPVLFLRLRVTDDGPGPYGKIAVVLLLGALAGGAAAVVTLIVQYLDAAVYQAAVRHRRAAWAVSGLVGAGVVLLAMAGTVALGWSGEEAGTVAIFLIKAMCSCAVGTGTALLWLGWALVRVRHFALYLAVMVLSLYLSAACFLVFEHRPPGGILVTVPLVLMFAGLRFMRQPPITPTAGLALLGTVVGIAETHALSGDQAARLLAQAIVAAFLGTVTVSFVRRLAHWHGRLGRFATTAAILPLAYVMFLWFDGQLLGGPLEVPFFAPLLWLALRLWRRMQADGRTQVSAAADIVFALLLGGLLVLFLVWLANLLALPVVEVRALRGTAAGLGNLIDLPWWTWASADVLLAAAFLTAALGSRRFRRITEVVGNTGLTGALGVLRRTLSVLKIVLLSLVFLGMTGPPALGPVVSRHVRDRYTVELQEELDARGEAALYQEVTLRFTASPQVLPVLTEMLIRVYDSTAPRSDQADQTGPTPAARDLAYQMGRLQAMTLLPLSPPSLPDANPRAPRPPTAEAEAAAHDAGMDGTVADSADLAARLTREQEEGDAVNEREQETEHAAEHAAAAVTGALSNVTFGHGVAIGLVREYLDGLAESGLSDVFLAWTRRALSRTVPDQPPPARQLVEPDEHALQQAADDQLADELHSVGVQPGTDPAQDRYDRESPVTAAVDLANHARSLQRGTVHCTGCVHFVEPGEGGGHGGEEEGGFHGE
ncbi:hypothetical protein SAMN05216223_116169 [Actinacidiphila yanglinensis]|uniref:Uncharacterized protein n=1 Tax=Actinacidiphila yanglinensis TaxID=310779 RepID=A0A1H6DKY8_9ACTN|nr:hypothetical protein [Actinacidiphila yanglinensis]SEG85932.1 hypothetical protein SAMN05216223_116169 [Actinacidiphila yanglinensis]